MNFKPISLLVILVTAFACSAQKSNDFHYIAQTRGFKYEIKLDSTNLYRFINSEVQNILLSTKQLNEISKRLNKIDYKGLESNIDSEKMAIDALLKGIFEYNINNKPIHLEFDHNKLPKSIKDFLMYLESLH